MSAMEQRYRSTPRAHHRARHTSEPDEYSSSENEEKPVRKRKSRDNLHGSKGSKLSEAGAPSYENKPRYGLTTDESTISPLDTSDVGGMNRLYTYLSGSEGDIETDNQMGPKDTWSRLGHGSQSSLSSEDQANCQSHLSLSDAGTDYTDKTLTRDNVRDAETSTLPSTLPSMPAPPPPIPPPPLEEDLLPVRMRSFDRRSVASSRVYAEIDPDIPQVPVEPPYLVSACTGGTPYNPAARHSNTMSCAPYHSGFPRTVPPKIPTLPPPNMRNAQLNGQNAYGPQDDMSGTETLPARFQYRQSMGDTPTQQTNDSHSYEDLKRQQNTTGDHPGVTHLPPLQTFDPPNVSRYSFQISPQMKKPKDRGWCSWKRAAIILGVVCLLLLAFVAYLIAMQSLGLTWSLNKCLSGTLVGGANSSDGRTTKQSTVSLVTVGPPTTTLVALGSSSESAIPPRKFWKTKIQMPEDNFLRVNLTIPLDAVIGVYGRRNLPPTHTQYDFFEVFQGNMLLPRTKRAIIDDKVKKPNTAFVKYVERGLLYLAFYNDGDEVEQVSFHGQVYDDMGETCPNNCNGHGDCSGGQCHCFPGFQGKDCLQTHCPVLCGGNGIYVRGACNCYEGWKGPECNIPEEQCLVPNCNGNGVCIRGNCMCWPGWKGDHCNLVDCILPNCSGHGVCIEGKCRCDKGFEGHDCGTTDPVVNITTLCIMGCSGHGTFNVDRRRCICDKGWTGDDCNIETCELDCLHGSCNIGRCQCDDGWTGASCDQLACDPRCTHHGFCNNGTCVCNLGWNGKHCSLDGCPNACNNHGRCVKLDQWRCDCSDGWQGDACEIRKEITCNDNLDNDRDGLKDCQDPDCCISVACIDSNHCKASPNPYDVLLGKQQPSSTASFFDRMKFLIEADSVQKYTTPASFNESQVSVIRGQVVMKDGTRLIGVRVSVKTQPLQGFTLTRFEGSFDLLVNGGGSVTLLFQRPPFPEVEATVIVPWNQMVTMDTVVMSRSTDDDTEPSCGVSHDYYALKPLVLPTWKHTQLGACPSKSAIIPESQVLQESIAIPSSQIHLVYHSSETPGYMSTVLIQLTPSVIPLNLALVHLKVSVEGVTFTKLFESDINLSYKFSWDRTNAYRQKVYGIVTAIVSVGYEYKECKHVFWERQSTTLSGYDMPSSEIGRWNLDIHHTYNYQEGILHKGDGTNIYLKQRPKRIVTILGNGQRRPRDCNGCDGPAKDSKLLAPVAMASGLDGSLYVGDYNYIRKLSPNMRDVTSILLLRSALVPYKYYMSVSPLDGKLYISDSHLGQILRIKVMGTPRNVERNFDIVAGTGFKCDPGDPDKCGDGGMAVNAKLSHPKGIAIDKDGVIYFADGANIRTITTDGKIHTLLGSQGQPGDWNPLPCDRPANRDEVTLRWPTSLAISPIDGSLQILDNNLVLKLTSDHKVLIVAGRPIHCPSVTSRRSGLSLLGDDRLSNDQARDILLISPHNIAFAPQGDIYIVETDNRHIHRVRVITTDGKISHYVGSRSKCDCSQPGCKCYNPDEIMASEALLHQPTSLTVTPDGVLHVADMGNLRVHSILSSIPSATRRRQYEVVSPDTQEIYVFNRYGKHIMTKDIMTDRSMYFFTYDVNTFYGRLTKVTDSGHNEVEIRRHSNYDAKEIVTPGGQVCKVKVTSRGLLQKVTLPDKSTVSLTYDDDTGLLLSKATSAGQTYFYDFDSNGRLLTVVQPTGEITSVGTNVDSTGAVVNVDTSGVASGPQLIANGNQLIVQHGQTKTNVTFSNDGSLVVEYPSGMAVIMETNPHPLLGTQYPMQMKQKIQVPGTPSHRMEWRYVTQKDTRSRRDVQSVARRLRVGKYRHRHRRRSQNTHVTPGNSTKQLSLNGLNVFTFEYNRITGVEAVTDRRQNQFLVVHYNRAGQPVFFQSNTSLVNVNLTYNSDGALVKWQRGDLSQENVYDNNHLLIRKILADGATYRFIYRSGVKSTDVIMPSGKQYLFTYDQHSNLIRVRTPELSDHSFYTLTSLGFVRKMYFMPGTGKPYIRDYNSQGHVIRVMTPSRMHQVSYTYSTGSKIERMIFDRSEVAYGYYPKIGLLQSINLTQEDYKSHLIYNLHKSLVSRLVVSHQNTTLENKVLLDATFRYTYNNNFLPITVNVNIGSFGVGATLPEVTVSYREDTGQLDRYQRFRFLYPRHNRHVIEDNHIEIQRDFDEYGRPKVTNYKFNSIIVFTVRCNYDPVNRLKNWKKKIAGETTQYQYVYDADGNVIDSVVDGSHPWKYQYDASNKLKIIEHHGVSKRIEYSSKDQVSSYDGVSYDFNSDGYLIKRNQEHLEYNSLGQLVHVKSPRYKVWFKYDGLGRLAVMLDHLSNIVQYFYGDILHRDRVTHTYSHKRREVTSFFYDANGILIAMDRGNSQYYVATDPSGSPTAIFNSAGTVVKHLAYDPYGNIVTDSDPTFEFLFGYRCGVYSQLTGLVFLENRVYDSKIGQYYQPNIDELLKNVAAISENPKLLNLYQLKEPINSLMQKGNYALTDIRSWLIALGYNIPALLPKVSFSGEIRPEMNPTHNLMPVISTFECAFERDFEELHHLSVVPKSKISTPVLLKGYGSQYSEILDFSDDSISPLATIFGNGVVLSVVDGRNIPYLLDDLSDLQDKLASVVFNDTLSVGINLTINGKINHYLVKEDIAKSSIDKEALSIYSDFTRLRNGVNVTLHETSFRGRVIKELRFHGNFSVINIRYGTDVLEERTRLVALARTRAVERAWERERYLVTNFNHGTQFWTQAEMGQIRTNGYALNYDGEFLRSVDSYPQLADDSNNVKFVPKMS